MSEITYYDYISGITLGAIAGAASITKVSILDCSGALIIWIAVPIILSYINLKSLSSKMITGGKPLPVIKNGIVDDVNLKKARYTIEDLLMQLRKKDVFNLAEVEFALIEIDGEVSVLKKSQYKTVTPKDLAVSTPSNGLTLDLIINGAVIESNLDLSGNDKTWLNEQLKQQNINNMSDVIYAGYTSDKKLQIVTENNLNTNQNS
jgi:uncharacterized membrane protein YcaP (DUF421 family)